MVSCGVKVRFTPRSFFAFSKFKLSISSAQRVLHIKMCLETKFYIFWNFFIIFKLFLKISFWYEQCSKSKITIFGPSSNSDYVHI